MKRLMKPIGFLTAGILPLFLFLFSIRFWEMDLTVFPRLSNDSLLYMYSMKSVQEFGLKGYILNDATGAPEVSALGDIILNDFETTFFSGILVALTGNVQIAYHLTQYLYFALAGSCMYLLLRELKVRGWISILFSASYSLAPYQFIRLERDHLVLLNTGVVPIGILLGLYMLKEDFSFIGLFREKKGKQILLLFLSTLYIGFSFGYYPPFVLILLGVALLVKMIRKKSLRPLLNEAIPLYLVGFFFLLAYAPKVIFRLQHGPNMVAAVRFPWESEYYGMKIIQLFVPGVNNHSALMERIRHAYEDTGALINENNCASLGLIALASFLFLCAWLIVSFVKKDAAQGGAELDYLALSTLTMVLFCTVGGLGSILSYVLSPQIRCWCRGSILIAACSLAGGAIGLEYLIAKANRRWISVVVCCFLAVILRWDQLSMREAGWQKPIAQEQASYEEFFAKVEETAHDTMIYQLPYEEFYEEVPLYNEGYSAAILPYLFTETIHWSGGGAKGRNVQALQLYQDEGQSDAFVDGIRDVGFDGVYVDTWALEDGGAAVNRYYMEERKLSPIISSNGRMYFYDLRN